MRGARPECVRRDRASARDDRAPRARRQPDRRARRLRRRRRVRHRDHGPRAACAGGGRRLVPARPARPTATACRSRRSTACARDTGLLVTVDCAITAVEEVAAARAAGVDVVVCDHHAPRADGRLPDCEIVHPGLCGYPCVDLCGTGVAYKVAQALGAPGVERRHRARGAGHGCRPDAAASARTAGSYATACSRCRAPEARAAGVDDGCEGRSKCARHRCARRSGWRRASTPRAGSAAPTRASSCCSPATIGAPPRSPPSSTASMPSAARSSSGSYGRPKPRSPSWASATRTCWPPRAGTPASSGSSPHGSSSTTTAQWSWSRSRGCGLGLGQEHPRL